MDLLAFSLLLICISLNFVQCACIACILGEVRVGGLTLTRKSKRHRAVNVHVCYKGKDRLIDYIKIDIIS